MKSIAYPLPELMRAIDDAGLRVNGDPLLRSEGAEDGWPNGGLGQDVFVCFPKA